MMVQSYNSSTGETKAGRSTVQGQLEKIARHCLRGAKKKRKERNGKHNPHNRKYLQTMCLIKDLYSRYVNNSY
jgi:hypothetical protein